MVKVMMISVAWRNLVYFELSPLMWEKVEVLQQPSVCVSPKQILRYLKFK